MPLRGCHSLNAYQGLGALGWAVHSRCKSVPSSLQSYETGAIILPHCTDETTEAQRDEVCPGPCGLWVAELASEPYICDFSPQALPSLGE